MTTDQDAERHPDGGAATGSGSISVIERPPRHAAVAPAEPSGHRPADDPRSARRRARRAGSAPAKGGRHRFRFEGFLDNFGQRFVLPYRWFILAAAALFVLAGAALGPQVISRLSSGGFVDPGSDSAQVASMVDQQFAAHNANLILVVTAREGTVDDPAIAAAGADVTSQLAALPGLRAVRSYWTLGHPPDLRSGGGEQALVLANVPGDDDEVTRQLDALEPQLPASTDLVTVGVGGQGAVYHDVATSVEQDLRVAELIAFPLTGLLLVLAFGTIVAAGLPLAMGVVSVIGTIVVLTVLSSVTSVSVYALNLATGLGLGLSIDYSLFMLSRFREERAKGLSDRSAILQTMQTAGRAVTVSGLTVAASLMVLLVFPLDFLRSFAYAGVTVSILAVLNALVVLPALMAVVGSRIERFPVLPRLRRGRSQRIWRKVTSFVIRRPVVVLVGCVGVLLLLGSPFLGVRLALPDDRVLPASAPSRMVQDQLRTGFPALAYDPVQVMVTGGPYDAGSAELAGYADALSSLPDVQRVESIGGVYVDGQLVTGAGPATADLSSPDAALVSVVPSVDSMSPQAEALVTSIRAEPAPAEVLVGGRTAQLVDVKAAIGDGLPWAIGLMAAATIVALLVLFGAVVVPFKAVLLNILSLTATFGAMVWIFQDGHFASLLGFTPTGTIDVTIPILMFCMAFGLSMDYEVFIMSRIKESYERTHDSDAAVVEGLSRTGGLVTMLALIIAVVFLCFATSGVTFIKLMGLGLAVAVLMDATVVRGLLVPALMRLTRSVNWWAPRWLRAVHTRLAPAHL